MNAFVIIGLVLLAGALCGKLMNRINMPAVTGYILAGLLLGASGFQLVDGQALNQFSFISDFALCVIAFTIGSELELRLIRKLGRSIFYISLLEATVTFTLVGLLTWLVTRDTALAVVLGAVSTAAAPAATIMVLRELGARGEVTSTLVGVIAVVDAIALMFFSVAIAVARVLLVRETMSFHTILVLPFQEIILSVALGALYGVALVFLLHIAKRDSESFIYLVALLLLVVGSAQVFAVSKLLKAMAMGFVVVNMSRKKQIAFHDIEGFSPPLIAAFFILAGARLDISMLPQIGLLGVVYLLARFTGILAGTRLGATIAGASEPVRHYVGFGLLSQVGVAVGLAITVGQQFPGTELASLVIAILLSTTIITEIVGPNATRYAMNKVGETNP